jgi:hyperosmotically inducible periplasmic protein
MKPKLTVIPSGLAATWLTLPAFAADKPNQYTNSPNPQSTNFIKMSRLERLGKTQKANEVIGMEVKNLHADNVSRNVRDRNDNSLTPLDQGSNADVDITRRIRKDILARDGLSANGRNIKVITVNGRVTLRGPVKTEAEKRLIGDIATGITGAGSVDNQIEMARK